MHITQLRVGTTTEWADTDPTDQNAAPVLEAGELGLDVTKGQIKVGDGSTAFPSLATAFRRSRVGTATLVAGTKVVSLTGVTSADLVFVTVKTLGTVAAPKAMVAVAGTDQITITSSDNTDTSVVGYFVVTP